MTHFAFLTSLLGLTSRYGGVGDARGWRKVEKRLQSVLEPLQKIGRKSESYYSACSIDEHLRASFIMDGKPYPKILTAVQQAALDAAALPETPDLPQ